MSRGNRTVYPDTGGFNQCLMPYVAPPAPAKSSSGTSGSSCTPAPQTSRPVFPRGWETPKSSRRPAPARDLRTTYKPRQVMENCEPLPPSYATQSLPIQFGCEPPEDLRPTQPRTPRTPTRSARTPTNTRQQCYPPETRVADNFDQEDLDALFGNMCPNFDAEQRKQCTFQEFNEDKDEGIISKIMKKIKGPPNSCPLKVDFSQRKPRNYSALSRKKSTCFSKNEAKDQSLQQLDELWNPDTFMRWKCIENWDQHKESLWRSVIQAKLDCREAHNRNIEDMMYDAFKAMNAPGGECISFRMIYGILRRNEDMYLHPYLDQFTDDQFLKLIIALNRFYLEDKDKRKAFFDHPPPTFIEKIMMKETLGVLDPASPTLVIARRFWELLLDWYARKITVTDDCEV
ncbi:hypothetical protein GE061_006519 [Apolygus lucorum]|uniref:Uncharacterized protein n=1 Tax=Apolygus lucorum TaxID=248454 RepID=A0A6A4J5N8_APOLU|nr:hypothetical protein GE061_006519 [Apolygus lucorum]